MDVLISWVGARDPTWINPRTGNAEAGPVLALLQSRHFDATYLLLNLQPKADDFAARATAVTRACQKRLPTLRVYQKPVYLVSVTDYREVFAVTNEVCQEILQEEGQTERNYFVYLSPGTPQMQTVWILLVQSGLVPAKMIAATPPDLLAPGVSIWQEVDLSFPDLPQVTNPGEAERRIRVLETQNENLRGANSRLQSELALARAGGLDSKGVIAEGFRIRSYLLELERALYTKALTQAGNRAAAAARLLAIEPATFRKRAAALGVRPRRSRQRPQQ
jgi:hypothetical protein